jgi:hypothetical protein
MGKYVVKHGKICSKTWGNMWKNMGKYVVKHGEICDKTWGNM